MVWEGGRPSLFMLKIYVTWEFILIVLLIYMAAVMGGYFLRMAIENRRSVLTWFYILKFRYRLKKIKEKGCDKHE